MLPQRRAHSGAPFGQQQCAARCLAKFCGEEGGAAELAQDQCFKFRGRGQQILRTNRLVAVRDTQDETVVRPHGFDFESALGAQFRGNRHAPRRVNRAAKGSQHAHPAVSHFVAAYFNNDIFIARNSRGGGGLLFQIFQQIFRGIGVQAVLLNQFGECHRPWEAQEFPGHLADFSAELHGTARGVAFPERHFAGFTGSGRYDHLVVRNFFDAPGGRAQNDGVALAAFKNHLFVEFAHARAACCAGQKNAIEAAIGNGAAIDNGHALRALAGRQFIFHPVPGDARTKIGEFIRRIAAGKHVEHAVENCACQRGVRRGATNQIEKIFHRPIVQRHHRDDLLRQNIQRIARIVDGFHLALVHRARDGGARHQICAIFGENDGVARGSHVMAGAAHTLHAAGNGRRRLDLNDQIDRTHVDPQLQRGSGHDCAQRAQF